MRYMITDELWAILGPCVEQAKRYKCGRAPALPERLFFEAVLYLGRTGIPWRDLPGEFGAWTPCTTGSGAGSPAAAWPGCSYCSRTPPRSGK